MIQRLLERSAEILRTALGGTMPGAATRIEVGPSDPPAGDATPHLLLLPGPLTSGQDAAESPGSAVRPRPMTEVLAVLPGPTYPLAQQPLDGSLYVELIYDRGTVDERRELVYPDQDYVLDPQVPNVTFSRDISAASHLRLKYNFAGVFTFREINQTWYIDIYEDDYALAERWASLALSTLLTNHDELVEHFNETSPTFYAASDYVSEHRLITFGWRDLQPVPEAYDPVQLRLAFQASAQLMLAKTISGGFGTIDQIRSPGVSPTHPVDVEIGLG